MYQVIGLYTVDFFLDYGRIIPLLSEWSDEMVISDVQLMYISTDGKPWKTTCPAGQGETAQTHLAVAGGFARNLLCSTMIL